jgi:hypothetical protein
VPRHDCKKDEMTRRKNEEISKKSRRNCYREQRVGLERWGGGPGGGRGGGGGDGDGGGVG